ncbi:energy transducer TonB [Cesiribacter andamanensis]|uniref:Gram-negative bacterial tonB protein n=1 Tax=Cesiribacter andamanensis AMV16 TaxID=1279009 RepID=M7N2N6_9BACT|nr:energy transducer TonB [Cesiribacter andamanensis]EMR01562.1 Gram-negative bacterial tonB protein [Cesiribacter andamanensis AMV16]
MKSESKRIRKYIATGFFALYFVPAFGQQHLVGSNVCYNDPIDQEAEPIGGMRAFYKFIENGTFYPPAALFLRKEGTAYIYMIINEQGDVVSAQPIDGRELGWGLDDEAVRLVKLSKWKPARHQGNLIKQQKVVPIYFRLP